MGFFTERSGISPKEWDAVKSTLTENGLSIEREYIVNSDGLRLGMYFSRGYPETDSCYVSVRECPPQECIDDVANLRKALKQATSC